MQGYTTDRTLTQLGPLIARARRERIESSFGAQSPSSSLRQRPIFVCGCHRSGTTLVRYLLDAHPAIACPPETKFVAGFVPFLSYPQALRGLVSLGLSASAILRACGDMTNRLMQTYAENLGKRRWADKTPNYYRLLPMIDEMFTPQPVYLLVVRHPLDVIDSLRRVRSFHAATTDDPDILRMIRTHGGGDQSWAHYWLEVNSLMRAHSSAAPDRCVWLRYEDLVTQPAPVMQVLFSSLGEDMPAGIATTAFTSPHTQGYGDDTIRRASHIYPNRVGLWRAWTGHEVARAWHVVEASAVASGYTLD